MREFNITIIDTGRSIFVGYKDWAWSHHIEYEKDDIRRGSRDAALKFAVEEIYFKLHQTLLTADKEDIR